MDTTLARVPSYVDAAHVVDFDIYNPPGVESDYYAAWKTLQMPGGPEMVWTPRNGGHWIAVRGRTMKKIWLDPANFSSRVVMVPKTDGEQHQVLPTFLDVPAYTPYRALVTRALSPKRVLGLQEEIRSFAISLIDDVRDRGTCDFVKAYAERLPINIFLNMCNLPSDDGGELKKWTDRMLRPDESATRAEVRQFFRDYLSPLVASRRGSDSQDLISIYANGTVDGRPLTEDEAVQMSMSVLFAGLDTVVNFLCFAMHFLATHPSHRDSLVADPHLIPAAVEELLRRFPIVTHGRIVTRDQRFAGVDLREGDVVILPTALHGMDETENDDPLEVDFHRENIQHSTFGHGTHRCIGLLLAKIEIRITLEEWTSRIPDFRLAPGSTIRCSSGMVGTVDRLSLVWNSNSNGAQ